MFVCQIYFGGLFVFKYELCLLHCAYQISCDACLIVWMVRVVNTIAWAKSEDLVYV